MTDRAQPAPRLPERVVKMEQAVVQLQNCVAEVGDATLGTRRSDFRGGGREEDGLIHRARRTEADITDLKRDMVTVRDGVNGLKSDVTAIRTQLSSSGPRRGWNMRERVIAAVISACGLALAALIGAVL